MSKRQGWSARDVFVFALHALDHGCSMSTGPGQEWLSIRRNLGDVTRSVHFEHDGNCSVATVEHRSWTTTDCRWLDPDAGMSAWCGHLAIPEPSPQAERADE